MAGDQHPRLHLRFCHLEQVQVVGFGLSVHPLGCVRYQSRSEKDPSDFTGAKIATVGSFSFFFWAVLEPSICTFQVQRCQGEDEQMTFLIQIFYNTNITIKKTCILGNMQLTTVLSMQDHHDPYMCTPLRWEMVIVQCFSSSKKVVHYIFTVILNQASHLYRLTGSCVIHGALLNVEAVASEWKLAEAGNSICWIMWDPGPRASFLLLRKIW